VQALQAAEGVYIRAANEGKHRARTQGKTDFTARSGRESARRRNQEKGREMGQIVDQQ